MKHIHNLFNAAMIASGICFLTSVMTIPLVLIYEHYYGARSSFSDLRLAFYTMTAVAFVVLYLPPRGRAYAQGIVSVLIMLIAVMIAIWTCLSYIFKDL